jgi:hypothetical protein
VSTGDADILSGNGVAGVAFGAPVEEAVRALTARLGDPTLEMSPNEEVNSWALGCAEAAERVVRWPHVVIGTTTAADGSRVFSSWSYSSYAYYLESPDNPAVPPRLTTRNDVTLDETFAEVQQRSNDAVSDIGTRPGNSWWLSPPDSRVATLDSDGPIQLWFHSSEAVAWPESSSAVNVDHIWTMSAGVGCPNNPDTVSPCGLPRLAATQLPEGYVEVDPPALLTEYDPTEWTVAYSNGQFVITVRAGFPEPAVHRVDDHAVIRGQRANVGIAGGGDGETEFGVAWLEPGNSFGCWSANYAVTGWNVPLADVLAIAQSLEPVEAP